MTYSLKWLPCALCVLCVLCVLCALPSVFAAEDNGVTFFEKKIRPILLSECYKCHSLKNKVKANLRLDWKGGWQKGGESGAAIIPGQVGKSLLIQAIRHSNADIKMPPKKKLTSEQIADFEKWVAMGAPDPRDSEESSITQKQLDLETARRFWAFLPVKKKIPPDATNSSWPHNDIDRFVIAAQEAKGIGPVNDTDNITLLRRMYFDLIGLPPEPEIMERFIQNASINKQVAIQNTIDELLSSSDFGARWGRHWLDIARYSDSTGGGRTLLLNQAWRYRDYVVNSFNADKPYDQFVREQIAGDLIKGGSVDEKRAQLIATGFLLLGPTNYELQDKTVLEMDIIDEQLDTIGKTFLGLTIGCARCHDHKFDPIRTADYYGMAGILKSTKAVIHSNVSTWNKRPLPKSPEQEKIAKKKSTAIEAKKKAITALKLQIGKDTPSSVPLSKLRGIVVDDLKAKLKGMWTQSTSAKGYVGANYIHDDAVGKGEKAVAYTVEIPEAGKFEVRVSYTHGTNRASKVPILIRHADGEVTKYIDQTKKPPIDGSFISLGNFDFLVGEWEAVVISTKSTTQHVIADAVQFLSERDSVAGNTKTKPPPSEEKILKAEEQLKKLESELKELQKNHTPNAQVIAVEEQKNPSDIHIAVRGNVHNVGKKTPRSFIEVLYQGPNPKFESNSSGRAELAGWLSSDRNPLTARVFVNRVWSHLFGEGIVTSLDNFGHMGQLPTNPDLLDHLAIRFMEEHWSVKNLIREIMLSRVYQLSSSSKSNQMEVDIGNKLFWRQNLRRLEAEAIRDSILSVSGQLDKTTGGPSLRPGTKTEYGYKFDSLKRSVYTPVFRNTLPEIMQVFDFADPNLVIGKRTRSSVPTQALFLMNSPFIHHQSEMAAKRLLNEELEDDTARAEYAYRLALGRNATSRERQIILNFLENANDITKAWTQAFQGLFSSLDFRYLN